MTSRIVAALGGSCLGCSVQPFLVERFPALAAAGAVVGGMVLAWAMSRPEPIEQLSHLVLYQAHRHAVEVRDEDGAQVIAAEIARREEVARG